MSDLAVRAVTRDQAAAMYGISLNTIRRAIHAGSLRARMVGRSYRLDVDDLAAWFAALPEAPISDSAP